MMTSKRWMWCAVVSFCCVAGGCETDNRDDNGRDRDLERAAKRDRRRARDRDIDRSPDPVIARDRDRRDPIEDRSGRAGDRRRGMAEIPTEAMVVESAEGGGRLDYEPARDGVVYVYDVDDDRVIYVGRLRGGERFRLDPDGGRAVVNTRTVFRSDLNPRHRYRLYFERAG